MPGKGVITAGIHETEKLLCTACNVIRVRPFSGSDLSEAPHVAHHRRSICHWLDIWMGNCCKLCELRAHITPSERYKSPFIAHLVTVVRCAENSNAVAIMGYLIAIILHLQYQYFFTSLTFNTSLVLHHLTTGIATNMLQQCQPMLKITGCIERTSKAEDASHITEHTSHIGNDPIHQQLSKTQMTSWWTVSTGFTHFMTSDKQIQLVVFKEVASDIWAKTHPNPSLARAPPLSCLGITPQHLTHQAILRRFPTNMPSTGCFDATTTYKHLCKT